MDICLFDTIHDVDAACSHLHICQHQYQYIPNNMFAQHKLVVEGAYQTLEGVLLRLWMLSQSVLLPHSAPRAINWILSWNSAGTWLQKRRNN